MGKTIKPLLLVLCLLLFAYPVSAEASKAESTDAATQAGANMVSMGMKAFAYSIGDSFYQAGSNGSVNRSESNNMLLNLLTYTIDPFRFSFVQDWQKVMLVSYVLLAVIGLLLFAMLLSSGKTTYQEMSKNIFLACVLPVAFYFLMYLTLQINFVVSAFLASQGLIFLPLSNNNVVLYIIMGIVFLIMSVVMFARNIIILFFAAGGLSLVALSFIPQMKETVISLFKYFLVIVFMQPILIFIMVLGMSFLQILPPELNQFQALGGIVLGIIVMAVGITLLLGKGFISLFIRGAGLRL